MPQYVWKILEAISFGANHHKWMPGKMMAYLGDMVAEIGAEIGSVYNLRLRVRNKHMSTFELSCNGCTATLSFDRRCADTHNLMLHATFTG